MSSHTPGPWHVGPMSKTIRPDVTTPHKGQVNGGFIIAELYGADMPDNARLISAAPDGVAAATLAYDALIAHPHDAWRAENQHVYCALRDFIAKANDTSEQEVQDAAESAFIARAKATENQP